MRLGRCVIALALALGLAGSAAAAPTPKDKQEAATLTTKARTAAKAGRHDEAIEALRQADQLDPSPQRKLDLAKSLVEVGKLVEASSVLNAILNDAALGPPGKGVKDTAKKQLATFESRIPWLSVKVLGPTSGVRVEVDGAEIQPDVEVPVDPGDHAIGVEADGWTPGERRVKITDSEHKQVSITLEPAAGKPTDEKPASKGGNLLPAIAAGGAGLVSLGFGTAFGILAFDETSKAKQYCDGNTCPAIKEVVDARNAAIANGNLSTVFFVIGGVGIAAGAVLYLVMGRSSGDSKPEPEKKAASSVTVLPYFNAGSGAGEAGLVGQF